MNARILIIVCIVVFTAVGCSNDSNPVGAGTLGPVTDADGNVYTTVTIGNQTWMVENLRTTHYANGDSVLQTRDNAAWNRLTSGGWCAYNNDTTNASTYGYLYNLAAISDPRRICPLNWHIPTLAEWDTLVMHVGGMGAGGNLKDTLYWQGVVNPATNSSGFSARPGGLRDTVGAFKVKGTMGYWWIAQYGVPVWTASLQNNPNSFFIVGDGRVIKFGMSIRCVRDY